MLLLCGVVFGGVFGMKWFGNSMMNEFIDNMPTPAVSVSSSEVEAQQWASTLNAVGSLVAVRGADLTAEMDGTVTSIDFESGQTVSEGDQLLSLESVAERSELARLKAQAKLAEIEVERRAALFKRGTISKSEYDTAIAETEVAKAAADAQQGRVNLKTLRAPFAGELGIRRVSVGQYLRAGDAIVTLQALDPIELDFSLPEKQLGKVQPGDTVTIVVDALGNRQFTGEVIAVEPKIDPATRNFDLRARLSNPEKLLKPGLYAKVSVDLNVPRDVLVLPRTAIQYTSYGDSVYAIRPQEEGNKEGDLEVIQRFVTLGEARGDYIEIIDGLEAGDEVASSGLLKLRSGQPVMIENALKPQAKLAPTPPQG
ncbi:MAG: efflux RND transporter periplasmic adaptor subunit [Spongiibacter sp.]|nr:efflux RND transporter periplasmic adaptor subunit [Spongiibacter sp.]MBI57987.1 efflux RND transporter periplasmic adaptor subunit [Spongiibacter sp.]MBO6752025.1 efflux RND transporter periplasmic adaptor subunit [Spongiibacter sp.]MBU73048.1 efflux RND transporter periplasmic adaptor subunit [Spongiibacter sp.]